jgi:hypothetical protein
LGAAGRRIGDDDAAQFVVDDAVDVGALVGWGNVGRPMTVSFRPTCEAGMHR